MNTESYIIGFVAGVIVGRLSKGSSQVDPQLEIKMLDYLKTNKEFTVSQFAKSANQDLGFFGKNKIRSAASKLVKQDKIACEIPTSSSFFNRDETVKFISK